MVTGVELIASERQRQVESEGWTIEHDDQHNKAQLCSAAYGYLAYAYSQQLSASFSRNVKHELPALWPWEPSWWKPSDDPIRNLVKAGSLIAAEIDRLQRTAARGIDPRRGEMAWKQPKPRPSDAQCSVGDCGAEEDYPVTVQAGGVLCGGCGRRRPDRTYHAANVLPLFVTALELYDTWQATPTDRGGKSGPKGRAYAAFIAAKEAALAAARGDDTTGGAG